MCPSRAAFVPRAGLAAPAGKGVGAGVGPGPDPHASSPATTKPPGVPAAGVEVEEEAGAARVAALEVRDRHTQN